MLLAPAASFSFLWLIRFPCVFISEGYSNSTSSKCLKIVDCSVTQFWSLEVWSLCNGQTNFLKPYFSFSLLLIVVNILTLCFPVCESLIMVAFSIFVSLIKFLHSSKDIFYWVKAKCELIRANDIFKLTYWESKECMHWRTLSNWILSA